MAATVLVVEDDEILRYLTAEVVSVLGLGCVTAMTADKALLELETRSEIGLVITDVCMPGSLDGIELAKTIWARWPSIPVIVTSGNRALSADQLPARSSFLQKPWTIDALEQTVSKLMRR